MVAGALGMASCEGDQGEIGPKGDSADAEASTFGNIELTVSGVDLNGDQFTKVVDYKYLVDNYPTSIWYWGEGERYFNISRAYKIEAPDARVNWSDNQIEFIIKESNGGLSLIQASIRTQLIVNNTLVDYGWYHIYSSSNDVDNMVMSNYSFDEKTGALRFDFTYFTEESGSRVDFAGKVDAKVFKRDW